MKKMQSFRSRLLIGALLITTGLLAIVGMLATSAARTFPNLHQFAHSALLSIFALVFIGAGLSLLRRGLAPFDQLRRQLGSVRDGTTRQIVGEYPEEIQPLVSDLNSLLDQREQAVSRALAKAGDLAHGLKTPLAVLTQTASLARTQGRTDLAEAIAQQTARMRRHVDYHLAQARAAASGATLGARCAVVESADAIARTLRQLHAERGVTIDVSVPPDHVVRVQREDLDEMIGNLLDNACRSARSRARLWTSAEAGQLVITIDDDGPGLPETMWTQVLQRGVRADEAAPGSSGLGLAIVRDLAEVYGGAITLGRSPDGGLRARLMLPAQASPAE
jgi:signal transduction histidine kinase